MFTIEGIIGAGKSTLCNALKKRGYVVAQEPIEKWTVGPHNLLKLYYNHPQKYAYLFQMHVLDTLRTAKSHTPPGFATFHERSIRSNAIFSALQYEMGYMDDVEYDMYMARYYKIQQDVRGRIFLDVDVDTAMSRVENRGRAGEHSITRSYQERLKEKHDQWIENEMLPKLIIQGDVRDPNVVNKICTWVQKYC